MFSLLMAQIPGDPLAAASGWSAFGLTGLVLAWLLLRHLPAKDTQLEKMLAAHAEFNTLKDDRFEKMMNAKDALIQAAIKDFDKCLSDMATIFREEAREERRSSEMQFKNLAETVGAAQDVTVRTIQALGEQLSSNATALQQHSERNRQWTEMLGKLVEKKIAEVEGS